jgi:hypothetical protein
MTPVRTRSARALALVVVALLALTAAGCRSITAAVEVGDESISIDDFETELGDIVANEAFAQAVPDWVSEGAPSRAAAAGWATLRIRTILVDEEFARRGLSLPPDAVDAARELVAQQLGPDAVLALPDRFFESVAREQVLRDELPAPEAAQPTEAEVEALYEQTYGCDSGIDVAHILVATRAEADDVLAALAAGGDFAALAAERSTDSGSAAQGGSLGCFATGVYVAEFEAGVLAATEGEPTEPVESQFGFHVILTTAHSVPPLETVRDELVAQLQQQQGATDPVDAFLQERFATVAVHVDARYGTWSAETGSVTAPGVPAVPDERPPPLSG